MNEVVQIVVVTSVAAFAAAMLVRPYFRRRAAGRPSCPNCASGAPCAPTSPVQPLLVFRPGVRTPR